MQSTTRVYGAAIALVSGGYSLWQATTGAELDVGGWLMLLVGAIVVAHGVVLAIDEADRLGGASGPLMVVYAVVMLVIQGLREAGLFDGDGMGMGAGGPGSDPGMIALSVLMLVSGLIMMWIPDTPGTGARM